ncbi:DUF1254 domain-containing protein [Comamonas sp. CMM02]|uniref:DUF1254 domain-containing protein n=1 Tax=Comamonas sp. CMM02 TaxID=2769307 RepID=UPI0017872F52|nr:DUF1254 domain-containing protein [Comamonas sp. CMM02]
MDLCQRPVAITVPRQTGRCFVLELMDVYTNNFHKQDSSPLEFLLQAVTQALFADIFETLVGAGVFD